MTKENERLKYLMEVQRTIDNTGNEYQGWTAETIDKAVKDACDYNLSNY